MENSNKLEEIVNHPITRLFQYIILILITILSFSAQKNITDLEYKIKLNEIGVKENKLDIKENREEQIRTEEELKNAKEDILDFKQTFKEFNAKMDRIIELINEKRK